MTDEQVPTPKVAVGVDGSESARAALEWAAAEAERTHLPLYIVHTLSMPLVVSVYTGPTRFPPPEEVSQHGRGVLEEAVGHVRSLWPNLKVETELALEEPPLALLRRLGHGDTVVVGSRGLGPVRSALAGSAGVRLAAKAVCPVVVVPRRPQNEAPPRGPERIVVGVDGSDDSRRALRFALHRAAEHAGSSVVVVHSWRVPLPFDTATMVAGGWAPPSDELLDRYSEELVAGVLADVIDESTEGVDVSVLRTGDNPVDALVGAGAGADLIVVGSRGRGSVRGLLLGSATQGVLHNATVPVAVLPRHSEDGE
ncbi:MULTISPECIES: universal stress protein [unclassified Nocardiopsis]|uniref:universal stress protein n=1 Tax=unclassified Nocardiopsis TaxID=2649073 RepID=UPI001357C09B|nr:MULTISPECIES: universal stress protein [unclassified Nocardiopsis]